MQQIQHSRGQQVSFIHKLIGFTLSKRQRFVVSVVVLSLGLFFAETYRSINVIVSIVLSLLFSFLTVLAVFWSNYRDIRENYSPMVFVLPFFYTFAFGMFCLLLRDRILSRLILTTFYGIGLYSLLLSQNIFIVSSIRTIALLSSARLVSTVLVLITYFFLVCAIFSERLFLFPIGALIFIFSFCLISHSLWIYTLEKTMFPNKLWTTLLSLCLFELTLVLWFWPSNFVLIALFCMGYFYSLMSLAHLWFERKLFKSSLWEYVWISGVIFLVFLFFTFIFPLPTENIFK